MVLDSESSSCVRGIVVEHIGKNVYLVWLDNGVIVKKHLDQMVQYD